MSQAFEGDILEHSDRGTAKSSSTSSSYRKINDSVYEVHMPSTQANMDILFFHGLQLQGNSDSHLSTWRSRCVDGSIWPKQWLPEDCPNARILTISYDGSMTKSGTEGRMDMYIVAENLLQCLLLADVGQARPVIFVGHSFGGLVIKMLCLHAHKTSSLRSHRPEENKPRVAFLQSIRGIFYFATPHHGSNFTDVLEKLNMKEGELVTYARVFSKDLARLNQEFQDLRAMHWDWQVSGLGESLPTDLGRGPDDVTVIVEEASSRCENFLAVLEDHFSICQPQGKNTNTYQHLIGFISNIQLEVVKEIDFQAFPADLQTLPKIPVGPLSSLEDEQILQRIKIYPVVGLWGMGGIGKTTLSKAVFNNLHAKFEYTLFVENVKFISCPGTDLEKKLLEEVHHKGKMEKIEDVGRLREKEILVVLDDVENSGDTAIVRKLRDTCSPNSRFILTSRDRQTLSKVDDLNIYEVEALSYESSEMLFRSYAISPSDKDLPEWQKSCLCGIVSHGGGLPLVLEVLGRYLRDTDSREVWEQTLVVLGKAEDARTVGVDEVLSKIKVSYDSLGDAEKQMFIDAATIFQDKILETNGYSRRLWTLREAKAAWGVTHSNESLHWRTLEDRALVSKVTEDSPIKMHEHLKLLGQKLSEEPKNSKRLRCEDVESLSKILNYRGLQIEKVHSLQVLIDRRSVDQSTCLRCSMKKRFQGSHVVCRHRQFPIFAFPKLNAMEKLQYLQLEHCGLAERTVTLPRNVVIFHSLSNWDKISFKYSTNLVILSVRAFQIKHLPDSFCNLESLQFLYLNADVLKSLPESIGTLKRLRNCELRGPRLEVLPNSFGSLESLQQLTLQQCKKLQCLPDSIGSLENLRILDMECCSLKQLPNAFGRLKSLQQLTLQCSNLETLPEAFGSLPELQKLMLLVCERLQRLPESFGGLQGLHHLMIWRCKSLNSLPDSFQYLESLQDLTLKDCEGLQILPASFGRLGKLQQLEISRSASYNIQTVESNLQSLPDSFGELNLLRHLRLHCECLETLPSSFGGLKKLQQLKLECRSLKSLPDSFVELEFLRMLELHSNSLTYLPECLNRLNQLTMLRVQCPSLVTLPPSFGELTSLQALLIESSALKCLPNSSVKLSRLQTLQLLNCPNLESLPGGLDELKALQNLDVSKCEKLESLPESVGGLKVLQKLMLSECGKLESLPESLGDLKTLQMLRISQCEKLETLPESLGKLMSLQQLVIRKCSKLESLPESLGDLKALYDFVVSECEMLGTLPESLVGLEALLILEVQNCPKLEVLPDSLGQLRALKELKLADLHVRSIPSLHRMESLKLLELQRLTDLAKLPVVPASCQMKIIH